MVNKNGGYVKTTKMSFFEGLLKTTVPDAPKGNNEIRREEWSLEMKDFTQFLPETTTTSINVLDLGRRGQRPFVNGH